MLAKDNSRKQLFVAVRKAEVCACTACDLLAAAHPTCRCTQACCLWCRMCSMRDVTSARQLHAGDCSELLLHACTHVNTRSHHKSPGAAGG